MLISKITNKASFVNFQIRYAIYNEQKFNEQTYTIKDLVLKQTASAPKPGTLN